MSLGRLEDPEFTIKEAKIYTMYPGASPLEVEEEVTDRVETAVQRMPQVKEVRSISTPGRSEVTVEIKNNFTGKDLPAIWDELRRKMADMENELPPGAGKPAVNDDFGDVYGIFYAITGEGYDYRELYEFAKTLRRELLIVPGVSKVSLQGQQEEQVFIEIAQSKLTQQGLPPQAIFGTVAQQNLVQSSGQVRVDNEYIRISPTGTFGAIEEIENLLIGTGSSNQLVRLRDVADVKRGFAEVPKKLIRYNGKPALTVGISASAGVNVVDVGQAVDRRLGELLSVTPVGMRLHPIYNQPNIVDESVRGFLINLAAAVAIVVVVLLVFMGLRSGMLIGAILFLSVMGTLLVMKLAGIELQRISLGALIIAMGMLVDNAIVVTEGILVRVQRGEKGLEAASAVVKQTIWPLFGATVVGILAFSGIGLSDDSTGEFAASLFYVVLISLMLSWVLAITVGPLFCHLFLKTGEPIDEANLYSGIVFRIYRGFLKGCLTARWLTVGVLIGMLGLAVYGFTNVKQSFFPDSTTPVFMVDYWRAHGTDIRKTNDEMREIEAYLKKHAEIEEVTTFVGGGAERFTLVYGPESPSNSYGQFLIRVKDYRRIAAISEEILGLIEQSYPDAEPVAVRINLGPGGGFKIEGRFSGPDPAILRDLSYQAQAIMQADGDIADIRDDWRHREKLIVPIYSEAKARTVGVSRGDLAQMLEYGFSGLHVGVYREGDELIPIIAQPPEDERLTIDSLKELLIWSPTVETFVPVGQTISGLTLESEDTMVGRKDRKRTIVVQANPRTGLASEALSRIKSQVEAIDLPPGYEFEWGGEYENSNDASSALFKQLPMGFIAMIICVVLLFGKARQPLIIWICVPLSIIGVSAGLLATNQPFGFMALLGFLSLTGMLIKNAIVLIDQIDMEIADGKHAYNAIVDSSVSRVRPVSMAAITTILGMIPLLPDAFFVAMAVTIMAGLAFATGLTLVAVPVFYAIFFKVKEEEPKAPKPKPKPKGRPKAPKPAPA